MFDHGPWLIDRRGVMDRNEAAWLDVLAEFDQDGAWADEGQLNCAAWLIWRCGMARSTAYEKLRVAHELRRRRLVQAAFAAGEITYSAARAITSIDDASLEVDEALLEVARSGSITDVEAAVRYYQCLDRQERGREFLRSDHRQVRIWKGHHGLGQLRATLTNDELEALEGLLRAFMDPPGESAIADSQTGVRDPSVPARGFATDGYEADEPADSVDPQGQSAGGDSQEDGGGMVEAAAEVDWRFGYGQSRADALMEVAAVALAHAREGHALGADRYMVHLVADADGLAGDGSGRAELIDGSSLPGEMLARLACDASFVAHLLSGGIEPLALGRKVRNWSVAQRRAIAVRDAGHCRFPGCERRITDVHHVWSWEDGGSTDVANGVLLCRRHHTLVQQGFRTEGDANGRLVFHRHDGSVLATTDPPAPRSSLFSR